MTESNLTEQEHKARQELFRYTDLSHPVMQAMFDLQVESPTPVTEDD